MKLFEVANIKDRIDCEFDGSWTAPSTIVVTALLKQEHKDWTNEWQDKVIMGEALINVSTHTLYISRIDAKPRGQGYGSEMLAEIIAAARAHNMPKIEAYVESNNPDSKNMFRKAGFTETPSADGGRWRLDLNTEELDERAILDKPISIFRVVVSDHVEQQRHLPDRNVSWIEINQILNKIPRIKKPLADMQHFNEFYVRNPATGAELGCQLRAIDEGKIQFVLFVNTVVRNMRLRQNAKSPIIEI